MSKLNERNEHIEQIIEFAQDSGAVGAVVVCGDAATESGDLRVFAVPGEESGTAVAYTRLTYMLASDLEVVSSQVTAREDALRAKRFELSDGVVLTLSVAPLSGVPTDGWYRIVWDDMGAASALSSSVPEDILCDLQPAVAEEPAAEEAPAQDDFDDDFYDLAAITPAPAEEPAPEPEPQPEPQPQPKAQPASELDDYLEFVSRNLRNAQRAIAAGQLIRAGEIVSVLRKMAIELICVRNGVDSNFEQSIDFIDCEEKRMLSRTYPKNMDQQNMVIALGTLSELFDRLI